MKAVIIAFLEASHSPTSEQLSEWQQVDAHSLSRRQEDSRGFKISSVRVIAFKMIERNEGEDCTGGDLVGSITKKINIIIKG